MLCDDIWISTVFIMNIHNAVQLRCDVAQLRDGISCLSEVGKMLGKRPLSRNLTTSRQVAPTVEPAMNARGPLRCRKSEVWQCSGAMGERWIEYNDFLCVLPDQELAQHGAPFADAALARHLRSQRSGRTFPCGPVLWYCTYQDPTRNGTRSIQNSLTFSYKTQVPFLYPVDFCKREKDAFSLYHTS